MPSITKMPEAKKSSKPGKGPETWMPFYGNDFFSNVEITMPPDIGFAYLRAMWVYWNHYHCAGLPDDERILRQVCRLERLNEEDWQKAKGLIFDQKHFRLNLDNYYKKDGLWHQERADQEWEKANKIYASRVKGGQKTANKLHGKNYDE